MQLRQKPLAYMTCLHLLYSTTLVSFQIFCSTDRQVKEVLKEICNVEFPDTINGIAFNKNGDRLAVCGDFDFVRILNGTTGETLDNFEIDNLANSVDFDDTGKKLAVGCDDRYAYVLDANTGDTLKRFNLGGQVLSVAFSLSM